MDGCVMITMKEATSLDCPVVYATAAIGKSVSDPMVWVPRSAICSATVLPAIKAYARQMSTTAALEALREDGSEPIATAALGKTSVELTGWWRDIAIRNQNI